MNRVNEKLLKKYSSTGPRYTSYPPATFFDTKFTIMYFKHCTHKETITFRIYLI